MKNLMAISMMKIMVMEERMMTKITVMPLIIVVSLM
jgi:hypothetical protein